jgi:uncharacterized protein (DUF1015 family)
MRYDPRVVGDVAEVTSPPYDVMDWRMIDALLGRHPHNIVRLILPRMADDPIGSYNAYAKGARRLARWRERGVLVTDHDAALYVYEYGDEEHRVRGLLGALELPEDRDEVVLPHEGTIEGIVSERMAMLSAMRANLEPILLVYEGARATADIVDPVCAQAPLVDVVAADGSFHRVWPISDPEVVADLQKRLAPQQALIADGHHRFEMYRRLRHRELSSSHDPGPWDRGLVLLIDQSEWPMRLGAVHRSVGELNLDSVTVPAGFTLSGHRSVAGEPPEGPRGRGELVLTDGRSERRIHRTDHDPSVSDAALLHERLLPAWGVGDDRIGYHHTLPQTVRAAHQDGGIAVLMHPASVAEVLEVARAGRVMPRKSTSFGPKPRMGLIMRSFDDEG